MKRKRWSKIWYVILLVFFLEGYALISEPLEIDATQLLLGKLFGTITEISGDDIEIKKFIFISEKMGYLILFHILYGSYLSDDFRSISVYIFSRATNRRKWFLKKVSELMILSISYTFLLVGILTAITLHQSGIPITINFWKTVFFLFCIQSTITILTTLLLNLCAVKWNILVSFLIIYTCICILVIAAIRSSMTGHLTIWNPFCYVELGVQTGYRAYSMVVWNSCLCLFISIVGAEWIRHMDISLQDKES